MKFILYIFLMSTFLISGNLFASPADELIETAENTRLKAAKLGFEWSTTSILIDKAKEAAKAGNSDQAIKFAKDAIKQGENSLKQAEFAAANWQNSEPK